MITRGGVFICCRGNTHMHQPLHEFVTHGVDLKTAIAVIREVWDLL